jgi:hypothetical protein
MSFEEELRDGLEQGRAVIERAEERLRGGTTVRTEIKELKRLSGEIEVTHLLLEERFRLREQRVEGLGAKAVERQRGMARDYRETLEEYFALIKSLPPDGDVSEIVLGALKDILDRMLQAKKPLVFGSLPYKHLNYPARQPDSGPSITPAYKGGDKEVSPEDLKSTPEAPISEEIAAFAQSLNWNPVLIYEYVKNNIETEWYWGCMKGAEETLRQGSGNDCDQATLLTALLRASGFPTRYVRGTIEFFAGRDVLIEKIKNLTGIEDPLKIAEFFQKAGIAYKPIIAGGKIANFRIEHIWVESRIPYANYRGVIIDEHGKTWLGLDTSIKVTGYEYNTPTDIFEEPASSDQLSGIRDEYLKETRAETPIEYIRSFLNSQLESRTPQLTYDDLLMTKTLIPEVMKILPASMQFEEIKISHEYTEIPGELIHKVRFKATDANNTELLDVELKTYEVSNKPVVITYEPETVEDQEIINSYGGLDNTPAYLIRLRPVLKVEGERVAVGKEGLPMGQEYELTIELQGAGYGSADSEKITNTMIVGNLTAIGIVAQKAVQPETRNPKLATRNAEQLLYEEAINYIDRWNKAEEELASLMHLTITRPLPTVVSIGGVIDVTYLLDTPHDFEWKGVYVDADLRAVETVAGYGLRDAGERQKIFMQLSSLEGSILENRIFEEDFKVESISTAKLFQLVNSQPATEILTIDSANIDTILPTLPFADNIKEDIRNAVNQNLTVTMPEAEITYEDWSGIGYIKENPETGEAGYMLSGMIAGGMTAVRPQEWVNQYLRKTLKKPYSEKSNEDPLAAARIIKIPVTDRQTATVTTPVKEPLAVFVMDSKGKPVEGAEVTFRVLAGGGDFGGEVLYTVTAGSSGIARAPLTVGTKTANNPYYLKAGTEDEYYTQVGLNIVTASVSSYSGEIPIDQPFEEYGRPDKPYEIVKEFPLTEIKALANSPGGSLRAMVADRYGNPVSNKGITLRATEAESLNPAVPLPQGYRNIEFYRSEECVNAYPLYGECRTEKKITERTAYFGAIVNTILGNTVNTKYTVEVSAAGLEPVYFTLRSDGYREAGDYLAPGLYIRYLQIVNDKGEPVNASKSGTELKAPLTAEVFMLYDEYKMEGPYTCIKDGRPTECYRIEASGIVNAVPVTDGSVTYTAVEGGGEVTSTENLGDGKYRATYKTGPMAAVNRIEAEGKVTVEVPEVLYDPAANKAVTEDYVTPALPVRTVTLKSGQEVLFDRETKDAVITGSHKALYTVYGVDTELTIEPAIMVLNGESRTRADTTFRYSIVPECTPSGTEDCLTSEGLTKAYTAITADVDLYETDENKNETWTGYLRGDKTEGEGTAVLVRGTEFDINKKYEAEVVLNRGTDVEVRGKRVEISIARIKMLNDVDTTEVDEVKFGDGSNTKKIYHVELVSKALTEACKSISGAIRVVDRTPAPIKPDTNAYYSAEYPLEFEPSGGNCTVKVNDITDGLMKSKFIISNLSKIALQNRLLELEDAYGITVDLTKIAVLYGGIGNQVEVEINGARKEILIEPVGVIMIGIDGLRQDVLYGLEEASYSDSQGCGGQGCYIDKINLPGLSQILTDNGTVKLKDVTDIFPSITFASWASIFTGKMPKDTGITGNEFFARDLYSPTSRYNQGIPGISELPSGMVTLDAGAFDPGGTKFVLNHVIPVEFSLFGIYDANNTLTKKLTASAPAKALLAAPFWGEIGSMVEQRYQTSRDVDVRCDRSAYECRTVSMLNQYTEGVDMWGTPDSAWQSMLEAAASKGSAADIMDRAAAGEAVDFIGHYFDRETPAGERKRFPALFSVYFSGLDHDAHAKGLSDYLNFLETTTDPEISKVVNALKQAGEFDNKIFIITADHGHTAMPTGMTHIDKKTGTVYDADTSCKLTLKDFDEPETQNPELANNNLHIWELGEIFKAVGSIQNTVVRNKYQLLVPEKIEVVFDNQGVPLEYRATSTADNADIVAAFNGPMAHIYSMIGTDRKTLGEIAEVFRVMLGGYHPNEAIKWFGFSSKYKYLKFQTIKVGRLWKSIDKLLIRMDDGKYYIFNGLDSNGDPITNGLSALTGSKYIEAKLRIKGMNNKDRSGDIVLIMKDKTTGDAIERYTTGLACKSWHGSLNPSDSYVPFIVAYPGGNKKEVEDILQRDTLCKADYSGCKGNWKVTDIVKEIIREQYQ